jgi:hypothetical protein
METVEKAPVEKEKKQVAKPTCEIRAFDPQPEPPGKPRRCAGSSKKAEPWDGKTRRTRPSKKAEP